MKDKIIKPPHIQEKEKNFIMPIVTLIVGLILLINAEKAIIFICYIIGMGIILFGIYNLYKYFQMKKDLKIEDQNKIMAGGISCVVGLLIIFLSGIIELSINIIMGIWLIVTGVTRLNYALQKRTGKEFPIFLIEGILYTFAGLYTIFANNLVFKFVGILLIINAIMEIYTLYHQKNS